MKFSILIISVALLLLLAGCMAPLPIDYGNMSPEQIREVVKDKGISAQCSRINTPYGPGIVVVVGVDKGMPERSTVTVDEQCKVTTGTDGKR